jgi:pimeloyl-ACP methyl ester carboxylesterase
MPGNLDIVKREPNISLKPMSLVFVHGAWHGAWCWEAFQSYFAEQGYVSYAVNLRGHGGSAGRDKLRWTSASEYVADLEQVVDQVAGPVILIGHSMGGYLIQKYLESRSAAAVVLLASIPVSGTFKLFNRIAIRNPWQTLKMHLTMEPFVLIETPRLAQEAFFSADMPPEDVGRHFARFQSESYRIGWDSSLFNLPCPKRVRRIPMLVLGGQNDSMILLSETEETAAAYGAKAEFFANMAHDMMLEKGWMKVAERITIWLHDQNL